MPTVMNGVSLNALTTVDTWSALSLFANGEQGTWYDPSDMSTMFQDVAGTIPVTAVEQPVGLILDKSKNLKSVFVGDLPFVSPWLAYNGGTIAGNTVTTSAGDQGARIPTVAGRTYRITANVASISGTFYYVAEGVGTNYGAVVSGQQSFLFRATGVSLLIYGINAGSVTYNSLRIEELPGNHANQSTAASRPVLSARVNMLTYTEQFDNAVWSKNGLLAFGSGSTANAITAPNGTTTADLITEDTSDGVHRFYAWVDPIPAVDHTISIYARPNGRNWVFIYVNGGYQTAYVNISTGDVGAKVGSPNVTTSLLPDNWCRIDFTFTNIITTGYNIIINIASANNTNSYLGNGTSGVYFWGADLRVTNVGVNLPAYQRVGAAVTGTTNPAVTGVPDYDTAGFPLYLKFDGVDDWLVTNTIDPGAVNKAQIFSGMRRTAVTGAYQCFFETSSSTDSNNGVIAMFGESAAAGARIYSQSRGTTALQAYPSSGVFPDITTNVLAVQSDISAPILSLRSNGTSVALSTSSQGTGNYLAYPLYIGRRGGTALPGSMQLYSLILRFSATNLATPIITQAENYINSKTKAY